jgi:hypothetical protein
VQVPPRGLWGGGGPATWFLAAAWLDGQEPGGQEPVSEESGPPDPAQAVAQLVLRYLGAYGRPPWPTSRPGPACPGCAR